MRAPAPLLSLLLALLLALGSVGMVAARAQAAGVTEMVICAGGQMGTVTLDARGLPVERPHHCPDCAPAVAALLPQTAALLRPQAQPARGLPGAAAHLAAVLPRCPVARGPPVPV